MNKAREHFSEQQHFRTPSMLIKWLRAPFRIGAVAPSSRHLAEEMVAQADLSRPGPVIELGGGTGAITRVLAEKAGYDRLITIEYDREMAQTLRHRFPRLNLIEGDAGELVDLLAARGIDRAATVVSGLPLLGMPPAVQRRIAGAAFEMLGPGGRMVQFTYGPASPLRPSLMAELGVTGRRAGHVWINLPPARVWCYEKAETR
ncbi:class I SAM-dependent methyltransferase [Zavarzinia compransoris]|uniref:class I SAM-dependent methyltransferase n=1 Tax=Zavarzinia compransoris TaxID=1264899 RepID=UPI001061808F|nr:rRNA adenine N-6-methyltransferase family protein [Zavarzinia compransoris]TDP44839.1 phosphatidylethanolamine/phosphatidyl-N-methylethanolamine N-methyltransferase [Zavarzinia compransoris]